VIDLAYILIYYIEICDIGHWPIFQVIATFIYFRPMKLLYRIKWVARVRAALSQSLLDIINVVVVLLMVWLMFAVFSMMFFENKMGYCD
jgi:cellobiose-specific phosphotransferase system component IIC